MAMGLLMKMNTVVNHCTYNSLSACINISCAKPDRLLLETLSLDDLLVSVDDFAQINYMLQLLKATPQCTFYLHNYPPAIPNNCPPLLELSVSISISYFNRFVYPGNVVNHISVDKPSLPREVTQYNPDTRLHLVLLLLQFQEYYSNSQSPQKTVIVFTAASVVIYQIIFHSFFQLYLKLSICHTNSNQDLTEISLHASMKLQAFPLQMTFPGII